MRFIRIHKLFLGTGLILLLSVVLLFVQGVLAGPQTEQAPQASPFHPSFPLLDQEGVNVLESGQPVSTMKTCGECHDTDFIASHSFHADLGFRNATTAGSTPSGRPWDTSTGLYGRWNPLTYRYLSPDGDTRVDLDSQSWVVFNAARLTGGGPAAGEGLEMNCFLCHIEQPDNTARLAAIEANQLDWAATATLLQTGVVTQNGNLYTWNRPAFDETGKPAENVITIQDPTNDNCAQCHGVVHTDLEEPLALTGCSLDNWQSATSGQIISGQKISASGLNLSDKENLSRSWDIHTERGLECTDCHYSINNPAYAKENTADAPEHLEYDPRRLEINEYLQRPDHNFAHGQFAGLGVEDDPDSVMRDCDSCHDESIHNSWLPYTERHLQEIACETCHIPKMEAPAIQSYDWTVLQADGEPVKTCRGVDGDTGSVTDLVTGFQPVLLERTGSDGKTQLAPYNLVTTWYWVYESPQGLRPVRLEDLRAAWLAAGAYAPEILNAFDENGDGSLDAAELRIDTAEKQAVVAARLENQGLANPHIEGEIQPYSINHNIANGDWATRECQSCHSDDSRLTASLTLSNYLPGGVLPSFVKGDRSIAASDVSVEDGKLMYMPEMRDQGRYIFGHNRFGWIDTVGAVFFAGVLVAVGGHGGLRFQKAMLEARRKRNSKDTTTAKKVYMYSVYERFWHWVQTFTIVLLLFTGLIIHRPDLFGFLSFQSIVVVHNVLAIILVINAFLSLFYHLVSGEIRQYIPHPYGFFDQAIIQAKYYLQGIFKGEFHPFEKTPGKKLNPLQQVTYFGILNVLLPLQVITGLLMFGVQSFPDLADKLGGLPFLAPFHSLVAWMFGAFIVAHVYLTTTGHTPLTGIQAMMNGWEEVEGAHAAKPELNVPQLDSPQPDAAASN